ncbi:MAG: NAD(P)H-hydrate dehydratase [Mangrovibacterium sp.]
MKIFTCRQIAGLDRYTMENEPVSGLDLMERAAMQISDRLVSILPAGQPLVFFAGPGNNGGDALAVARLLADRAYPCQLYLLGDVQRLKGAPAINLKRLKEQAKVSLDELGNGIPLPEIPAGTVVIDGLFGSGLSRPLEGLSRRLVELINVSGARVVAIDMPSGLMGEDNSGNDLGGVVRAWLTLSLQFPKLSFFFPEHEAMVGSWEVLPIGLHPAGIEAAETFFYLLDAACVRSRLVRRSRFAHKGMFGHALLIAGSRCKMGAAVLASRACLRAGAGLLTTHVPGTAVPILQVAVPEVMCSADASELMFTDIPDMSPFSAVGAGPGLGTKPNTQRGMLNLLEHGPRKLVLDADALNILAMHPGWLERLPGNAVLTPHPGEFERLAGKTADSWTRLQRQREFSRKYGVIVILKGAFTSVSFPGGEIFFNSSGNPGMATAGSGDVLTGIILGLLAQAMEPADAALAGVFLHGLAGDLAAEETGQEALLAGDLVRFLGRAFLNVRNQ